MSENSAQAKGPGRPRQPYCRDCIKAGRPDVPKKAGYGYCEEHLRIRQASYRRAGVEQVSIEDAREKVMLDDITNLKAENKLLTEQVLSLQGTVANLLNPMSSSDSGNFEYLHPYADEDEISPEDQLRALQGSYDQLREWVRKAVVDHSIEVPFYVKAQLDG